MPYENVFQKIVTATNGSVRAKCVSPFSSYQSQSVAEICDTVEALCNEDGQKYIYTYWHQPDYDMHDFGTVHKQITADITQINNAVEALCKRLRDTIVIVTADHGLIDTQWRFIPDYPDIVTCLSQTASIEARAMSFFIKAGMHKQFETIFNQTFGDSYQLFSKDQVLCNQLFGHGTPHPRSHGFIGDYLTVATGHISIECAPYIEHGVIKAAHAGMTQDEMEVPLVVVECSQ